MIELNLTASGKEQELIKDYLQNNASETLAEKINSGVKITKDNKTLLSKKDLTGFMKFANDEARKLAEKGANCTCVEDKTVFGWAIHYFEEDSIEGNLFNEDGTEYKVAPIVKETPKIEVKMPEKEKPKQETLFDFMTLPNQKQETESDEESLSFKGEVAKYPQNDFNDDDEEIDADEEEQENTEEESHENEPEKENIYSTYLQVQNKYKDAIVVMRVGDFYEIFGDNAEPISKVLDLTLTYRDFGLENKIALIGFPFHIAEKYIQKLNQKYNVVVLENGQEKYLQSSANVDKETGEILTNNACENMSQQDIDKQDGTTSNTNDDDKVITILNSLLDCKVEVKI